MLILIIVNHFCILDSFGVEMEKLSNKFDISTILTEGDPVTSAQILSKFRYKYIQWEVHSLYRGRVLFKHKRLVLVQVLAFKIIFILNLGYHCPSKCVDGAIKALSRKQLSDQINPQYGN